MEYAIIAAGEGSRLAQEGVKWPKPLVRLNDIPLIDRLVTIFLQNNASSIHIIVNEEMMEVQEHLRRMELPVPLNLVVRSTPSSMHSFYELSRFLQGDKFCLTTVDTIFKEDEFAGYIRAFEQDRTAGGYMAVTDFIDDEKPLYIEVDHDMNILRYLDQPSDNTRYISGGIYCLTRPAIGILEKAMNENMSRMRNYQRRLVSEGLTLKAWPFEKIVDVDHAGDITKAEEFLLS